LNLNFAKSPGPEATLSSILSLTCAKSEQSSSLSMAEAPLSSIYTESSVLPSSSSRHTEAALNSAYVQSTSLPTSNSGIDDHLASNFRFTTTTRMRSSSSVTSGADDLLASNYRFTTTRPLSSMNSGTEDPLASNCQFATTMGMRSSSSVNSGTEHLLASNGRPTTSRPSTSSVSIVTEAPMGVSYDHSSSLPEPSLLNSTAESLPLQPASSSLLSVGQQLPTDYLESDMFNGSQSQFHSGGPSTMEPDRSMVTARSVASAECASVDYDDDDDGMLHRDVDRRGSSGFDTSVSVQRYLSETRSLPHGSHGSSGFEVSVLDRCKLCEDCPSVTTDNSVLGGGSAIFDVSALKKTECHRPPNILHDGSSGFEVSVIGRHKLSEDHPSATSARTVLCGGSSGSEVSTLKKHPQLSECLQPVNVLVVHGGSSGFESPLLDQPRTYESDDAFCPETGRSDASLDAAMRLRDSTFSPAGVVDIPPPDSGTTSRTSASVDTNVLLQTTEDVVEAMEAARTNQLSHTTPRDPSLLDRDYAPFRYEETDRSPVAREDAGEDYETETIDMGKTRVMPSQRRPPAARGKSLVSSAASYGRRGTREAWGNLSDYDIPGDVARSRPKTHGHKTFHPEHQRAKTVDFDVGARSHTGLRSDVDRRHYTEHLRPRTGTQMCHPGEDSDRSLASSASLGEKIVAKSRANQRPSTAKSRTITKKNVQQRDRDSSPSGLVLEGCRVQLRPATASSQESRSKRTVNNARGPAVGTAVASRVIQNGRPRTSPAPGTRHNGWTEDLSSSLSDSQPRSATGNEQVQDSCCCCCSRSYFTHAVCLSVCPFRLSVTLCIVACIRSQFGH